MHKEVINELINPVNTKITPGLDRIKLALKHLGNPQNNYKVIHITGTNGKGSTATFIESGILHAGYNIGKYTSPHQHEINETIVHNGVKITDSELESTFFKVKKILAPVPIQLSPFELLTTLMFCYFSDKKIEYLILEVGMGGENDATNVINKPLISIITNISLEHTNWFGNSLTNITVEKSGIIKGNQVIIADNSPELTMEVKKRTSTYTNILEKYVIKTDLDFTKFKTHVSFELRNNTNCNLLPHTYTLNLFGVFQAVNFICAYEVFKQLNIAEEHIVFSAENTIWHGRLECISTNPIILLDATHNEAGAKALYDTLSLYYTRDNITIVTSILADKNIAQMLYYFNKISDSIIFTSIKNNSRGLNATVLYELANTNKNQSTISNYYTEDAPTKALDLAKSLNKKVIIITGSLYLLQYFDVTNF